MEGRFELAYNPRENHPSFKEATEEEKEEKEANCARDL